MRHLQHGVTTKEGEWGWLLFSALLLLQLWAAHAVVFFAHEFAHSFTAWSLGWKSNPWALDYAHPTLQVLLIQLGINQNVDVQPILASHHDVQAGLISAAGMVLGNVVVTYPVGAWCLQASRRRGNRMWTLFWFWVCVASVGNVVDYVPIRVFVEGKDYDQDMFVVERGFHWSPWTLLIVFGTPCVLLVGYLLLKMEPDTLLWLFPTSRARRTALAFLTAFVLFGFYGAAGLVGGGPIARRMSLVSVWLLAPLAASLGAWLARKDEDPQIRHAPDVSGRVVRAPGRPPP